MMKVGAVIVLAFAIVLLGSCAGTAAFRHPAPSGADSPPPNYLARSAGIGQPGSWAVDADLASGTLYEIQLQGNGENEQVVSTDGTARLHRGHLKIDATVPSSATNLLGSGTYTVTRHGGRLSVGVPSRGGLRRYEFRPNAGDAYNIIVGRLDSAAQQALAAAQQQPGPEPRQQAEAARLQAKAAQACSAVGGQIEGNVTVGTGGVSMHAYCAADPNRTWENPVGSNRTAANAGGPSTCSGLSVPFNDDGTLDLGDLQNTEWNYPGCFG